MGHNGVRFRGLPIHLSLGLPGPAIRRYWNSCQLVSLSLQIFDMMDAKARQDCIKEIDLLKVKMVEHRRVLSGSVTHNLCFEGNVRMRARTSALPTPSP